MNRVAGRFAVGILLVGLPVGFAARTEAQGLQLGQMLHAPILLLHSASQSYLGVDVADVDAERAQALHLKDASGKDAKGAEITVLDHDAPAGKVGLKLHDVIVEMNGQPIESADQVKRMLHKMPIGRKVQLLVNRDGVQQKVTLQMADRRKVQEEARQQIDNGGGYGVPAQGFLTTTSGGGDAPSSGGFHLWGMGSSLKIGALVEPLSLQTAYVLGVPSGLMIKSVARKSAADAAGLKPFDVILQVGSDAIVTSSDWERTLRSSEGKPVQVEILRDRIKQLVLLQVDGKRH